MPDSIVVRNDLGPVVRRPISANPGLNFNPGFVFFSSKAFFLDNFLYSFLGNPIMKLKTKRIKLDFAF